MKRDIEQLHGHKTVLRAYTSRASDTENEVTLSGNVTTNRCHETSYDIIHARAENSHTKEQALKLNATGPQEARGISIVHALI